MRKPAHRGHLSTMTGRLTIAWLVALCLTIPAANSSASGADDEHPEAASYARATGVTITEASRRLGLQQAAGELDEQIAGAHEATYGGLWIEHIPDFRIVVLATDGDTNIWRSLPASSKIDGLVEVRPASYSLARLEEEELAFSDRARALVVDMRVNVMENRIELMPTPATVASDLAGAVLSSTMWRDPQVRVSRPTANSFGGLALSNGCTTGFAVQSVQPVVYGFVTAGHCEPNAGVTLGGLATTFKAEKKGGSHDEQWHSTPNHTDLKQFISGDDHSPRPVTSVTLRANQAINSYLCKYGKTLGYRCGWLVSKTFQPSYLPNALPTFHQAEPRGGPDMSSEGDSGGPVFLGNSAWGIVSGQTGFPWCICDLVYTAPDYVQSGLGISIMKQ